MAPAARVCLIGLDAADETLVERWCAEGALPTLDRLRRSGIWVPLRHAEAVPSASVWPTVYGGTHAGRHGIVHPLGIVSGTLTLRKVVPEAGAEPPLWSHLAAAGARSIVVDVPFAPLTREAGTIQILDWGAYERTDRARSWPAGVLADVVGHAGGYPVPRDLSHDPPTSEEERGRDHARLVAGVAVKGAALRWLAHERPWDFFMATFTEAHAAGHHLWDVDQPRRRRDGRSSRLGEIYRAIDTELARFLDGVDLTTTTLILLSGHGMGRNVGGCQLVEPLLRRLGLLVVPPTAGSLLGRLRGMVPPSIRRAVSRRLPGAMRRSMSEYWLVGGIDPRRTRAFALPSDQHGFVRVNLAGREPAGPVRRDGEYVDLCRALAGSFRSLVDAGTGRPVVRRVFDVDETFPGPQRHRLPDLLVTWDDEAPIEAVRCEDGAVIAARPADTRPGNHRPDGFALVCGAGLPRGRMASGHLVDVAPTVLASFGLDAAPAMTGRSWLPATRPALPTTASPEPRAS
jgi:predicted AlkP superfamily phosphohydrolase/phosphomutase